MKIRILVRDCLMVGLLASTLCAWGQTPGKHLGLAIRAARMLDVKTGTILSNAVLISEGGKITAAGSGIPIPAGFEVLDLGGAMLLPGLVDSHTHLCVLQDPKLSDVANIPVDVVQRSTADRAMIGAAMGKELLDSGITTVRDLGNSGHNGDVALRDAIQKGWVSGPRMFVSTRGLAPKGGQFERIQPEMQTIIEHEYATVTSVDDARRAVRQAHFDGADHIKAYSMERLAPEELKAITIEAHRLNLKVAAHAARDSHIRMAVEAGVDSIEHGYQMTDDTLRLMAARKVVLVPTTYDLNFWREFWNKFRAPANASAEQIENAWVKYRKFPDLKMQTLSRAVKAGVIIAAGADMPFDLPGMTRGQVSLLVYRAYAEAGMTPLQIIRAATIAGAQLIGPKALCGSLEPGNYADVIAVAGDPLKDISELERVQFVMKEGVVVRNKLR